MYLCRDIDGQQKNQYLTFQIGEANHTFMLKPFAPYNSQMSPKNSHKFIRIYYMGGLILRVNALYMLSCFLKLFALVGKELINRCHLRHID